MYRRLFAVLGVVAGASLCPAPQSLAAVPCGEVDPSTKQTARAVLTLQQDSVTTVSYQRSTDPRTLHLIFRATGCDLGSRQPDPAIEVRPKGGIKDIPAGVVSPMTVRPDGSELAVQLKVDEQKFDPDTYGGLVEIRAPYLVTSRTPITVSRSEDNFLIPLGIGALGGLAGFIWLGVLKVARREKLEIGRNLLIAVGLVASVAGGIAVLLSYWDQEVWTLYDNWPAAVLAGFTGATTGTMLALVGAVWRAPSDVALPGDKPPPEPPAVRERELARA